MLGIKPIKIVFYLVLFFIFFYIIRALMDVEDNSTPKKKVKKSSKIVKPKRAEDGVEILNYLFKTKIRDSAMNCYYKRAKIRFFIACKNGNIFKDSYWEVDIKKNGISLLARSKSALYIINRYNFKELKANTKKIDKRVEKALIKFFKK